MAGLEDGIEDDASIPDNARLLRRIPPGRIAVGTRPDSSNFEERAANCGLSVTLWEAESDFAATTAEKPDFGIVCVTAQELREAGYTIVKKPLDNNPNHCECFGSPNVKRRRTLAMKARWVKVPEGGQPVDFGDLETL